MTKQQERVKNSAVLFICPTFPQDGGNGLSMRAARWLRILSKNYRVYLLIVPVNATPEMALSGELTRLCESVRIFGLSFGRRLLARLRPQLPREQHWRYAHLMKQFRNSFPEEIFDLLFAFRLSVQPFAEAFLKEETRPIRSVVDFDEVESTTRESLARLYALRSRARESKFELQHARYYEQLERVSLQEYDEIIVCSDTEKGRLSSKYGFGNVSVVPNTVTLPVRDRLCAKTHPFSFLFVGNFHYFPNEDAADWLLSEILPLLRKEAKRPFEVQLLGCGSEKFLGRLSQTQGLKVHGAVADLGAFYQEAGAALVPLRAGGGTRIKALEAFSYHVPIVSTEIGVEGLGLKNEDGVLLADDPRDFARECARLLNEPELRERLSQRAYERFLRDFDPEKIEKHAHAVLSGISSTRHDYAKGI